MAAKSRLHIPSPSSGFTLIELVIVLVILGIISAVAARPIANIFESWTQIGDAASDRSETNHIFEQVSRDVRLGDMSDCDKGCGGGCEDDAQKGTIYCTPLNPTAGNPIVEIKLNDKKTSIYIRIIDN